MNTHLAIAIAIFSAYCGNSIAETDTSSSYQKDIEAVKNINAEDGISQSEAHIIAKAFFWINISGCGFPSKPENEGEYWVSKTFIGIAGTPGEPVFINKASGDISWGNRSKTITLNELKNWKSN
jgi:hypothetical protein